MLLISFFLFPEKTVNCDFMDVVRMMPKLIGLDS